MEFEILPTPRIPRDAQGPLWRKLFCESRSIPVAGRDCISQPYAQGCHSPTHSKVTVPNYPVNVVSGLSPLFSRSGEFSAIPPQTVAQHSPAASNWEVECNISEEVSSASSVESSSSCSGRVTKVEVNEAAWSPSDEPHVLFEEPLCNSSSYMLPFLPEVGCSTYTRKILSAFHQVGNYGINRKMCTTFMFL